MLAGELVDYVATLHGAGTIWSVPRSVSTLPRCSGSARI